MRLTTVRRYAILLAAMLLPLLATVPPTARSGHAPAPAAAAPLFWYRPPLVTRFSPQRISSVAFDPQTPGLALATSGNSDDLMQRTTDHGLTWKWVPGFRPVDDRFSSAVVYGERKQTFYAYGSGGLYKTGDGGVSWSRPQGQHLFRRLVVQPGNPDVLYAQSDYELLRSLDGGETWTEIGAECNCALWATALAVGTDRPNILYAGNFYGSRVARSIDQGATWQAAETGLPTDTYDSVLQIIVDPRNADVVYALVNGGRVYKTTNGGGQWAPLNAGLPDGEILTLTLDHHHGYRLYAASASAIYTLEDAAQTWQKANFPPLPQRASHPQPWWLVADPAEADKLALFGEDAIIVGLPVPTIDGLSQSSAPSGAGPFSLVVSGANFTAATTVRIDGHYRLTRFISSTQVAATISAADLVVPRTLAVEVGWPGADESVSNTLPLTVSGSALVITRLTPDLRTAGAPALTLKVTGAGFAPGAQVHWNGAARPTTVISSTELTAQIGADDLAAPGAAAVVVKNPPSDGRTSGAATFMVAPQVSPVARRLRPAEATGSVTGMDITPDSASVVYTAHQDVPGKPELYVIPLAGGPPRKLNGVIPADDDVRGFYISPDNKYVVYRQFSGAAGTSHLYSAPLAGGPPVKLNAPLQEGEQIAHVLISGDSQRVIYLTQRSYSYPTLDRIYSVPIGGGAITPLYDPPTTDHSVISQQISPDGAYVVYVTRQGNGPEEIHSLFSIPVTGGAASTIAGPYTDTQQLSARITPDSRRIVVERLPNSSEPATIFTVPIDGGTPAERFIFPPELSGNILDISPNSQFVVVRTLGGGLHAARLDGPAPSIQLNDLESITDGGGWMVRFSPDSRYVVYVGRGLGASGGGLYSVPLNGEPPTLLSPPPGHGAQDVKSFTISPDGRRVIYLAYLDEEPYGEDLFSVPIDGSAPAARVSSSQDHERRFDEYQLFFTPDSRSILYRTQRKSDGLYALYHAPSDGAGPARNMSAPVPMVAGDPIRDDPYYGFEIARNSRYVVFLGGGAREGQRDLYVSDLPVERATITPNGGTATFLDGVSLTFPPGAVTAPVTVTYAALAAPIVPVGDGRAAARGFMLEAQGPDGKPVTTFAQPYTLQVTYSDAELAALNVDESSLNLAFWDVGAWAALLPCAGCGANPADNTVTARLDHFTEFALFGTVIVQPQPPRYGVLLPVLRH